jgi:hypothetical protein
MDEYCKTFTEDIFAKYDKNRNNVLERRELKIWIKEEIKDHNYLNRPIVQRAFE